MSTERYNTTERSSQDKKSEWEGSLVGHHQQHAAYLLHQNVQQAQHVYTHHQHHHLAGGTFRSSGTQPTFGNMNPGTIDGSPMQSVQYVIAGQGAVPSHRDESDGVSISHIRFGMPPLHISSSNNHKGSANAAARPHQARSGELEHMHTGKAGAALSMSTPTKTSAPRRMRNSSVSPLTVRPTGTKDRHSKVRTAKGLRDRRVRLSAPTAIQFFDVQDRLGYDQPSKAVDWLIKKARAAIDELAPVEGVIVGDDVADTPVHERKLSKEHDLHGSLVKVKDEEQSLAAAAGGGARAESRAKARERARERAKEKTTTPAGSASNTPMETSSSSPAAAAPPAPPAQPFTSTNLHLFPEFFMLPSQFRQQFDELHRPSDLSSMLTPPNSAPPPSTHLLPFASPFFPASSTFFPGDGPPLQYSAEAINYNTTTTTTAATNNHHNTPNSPRGTLQSIFSNPTTSSMQAHVAMPPLMMMGGALRAQAYGATTLSSIVSEGGHNDDSAFRQNSAEMGSPNSHEHSRIPMRIRGMEQLGSRVEEARITPSSMQAEFQ